MDKLTKEQRRKNMQAVKSKGSKIEKLLAKELWKRGYRYRKNCTNIFGKPDIVFKSLKIAVFCDSDFWHGKDWQIKKHEIKSNRDFWYNKIEKNIERDKMVTDELTKQGWVVLRFWGNDIKKETEKCINKIEEKITEKNDKIFKNKK